eukprot:TRINITY_DN54839_c0_g1_i1.p1 TRINITY_DN54839_c0_g1~~TRINITY_DN54839_c0_g1_i1.p1  ORF type:complete len:350 (+),score=96.92 TRINITY_DN54839_c0_g1_i1:140-1189(+)
MIRRPPRSTLSSSSAASDVYKRQVQESVNELKAQQDQDRLVQQELQEFVDELRGLDLAAIHASCLSTKIELAEATERLVEVEALSAEFSGEDVSEIRAQVQRCTDRADAVARCEEKVAHLEGEYQRTQRLDPRLFALEGRVSSAGQELKEELSAQLERTATGLRDELAELEREVLRQAGNSRHDHGTKRTDSELNQAIGAFETSMQQAQDADLESLAAGEMKNKSPMNDAADPRLRLLTERVLVLEMEWENTRLADTAEPERANQAPGQPELEDGDRGLAKSSEPSPIPHPKSLDGIDARLDEVVRELKPWVKALDGTVESHDQAIEALRDHFEELEETLATHSHGHTG